MLFQVAGEREKGEGVWDVLGSLDLFYFSLMAFTAVVVLQTMYHEAFVCVLDKLWYLALQTNFAPLPNFTARVI